MNIELLQEIKARILAEPDSFRMDTWTCGTAHCIAGWAVLLSGLTIANPDAETFAQRLTDGRTPDMAATQVLDIPADPDDWDSPAERLFHVGDWPAEFEEAYEDAGSRSERAQIAANRIDRFIDTDGAE